MALNLFGDLICFVSVQVFLTVALFNNIRGVMTLFFPGAITFAAEADISVQRIEVSYYNISNCIIK